MSLQQGSERRANPNIVSQVLGDPDRRERRVFSCTQDNHGGRTNPDSRPTKAELTLISGRLGPMRVPTPPGQAGKSMAGAIYIISIQYPQKRKETQLYMAGPGFPIHPVKDNSNYLLYIYPVTANTVFIYILSY